jgi:hypothetical protein
MAWNGYQLIQLRRIRQVELPDSKYFELKFKIQFLVAMFTVFAALATFYGYSTLEDAKEKL